MNFLKETKQHYFFVMIIEFIFLSCVYWLFFSFTFPLILAYLLFAVFYITSYRFWIKKLNNKENLLFSPLEQLTIINIIVLLFLSFDAVWISRTLYSVPSINYIFDVYYTGDKFLISSAILMTIFICYYFYRTGKQEKTGIPVPEIPPAIDNIIQLSCLFLFFDLIALFTGKLSILLILYLPFLFLILTLLIFIYKKNLEFKSLSSAILFFNIYINATLFLFLNCISLNFFLFTIFFHCIIFLSVGYLMSANSTLIKDIDFENSEEFMFLVAANIVLIFISLSNVFCFILPEIFKSYTYFAAISLLSYILWHNYKTYLN